MRVAFLLAVSSLALSQPADPAYEPLARAYESLKAKDFSAAVSAFQQAIQAAPKRSSIRKDLAYAYLKIGENGQARAQFHEAMVLDPEDVGVAMEYAFLCYESKEKVEARRIFDRLRQSGNAIAEQAFRNIDAPLAEGIARWQEAIRQGSDNYGAHSELASLAEQRDDLKLAAEHYRRAWELRPDRRETLLNLARVWSGLDQAEAAAAALLAASRGEEARTAEAARELLPSRYPYVHEFRRALELDSGNVGLRRELAYLLLQMGRASEAEAEFRLLADAAVPDLLSCAQLGFLLYNRGERESAKLLLDKVLSGQDLDLANRVRAVLGLPPVGRLPVDGIKAVDPKEMAEISIKAGYLKDALGYLREAHTAAPTDYGVVLRMGWACNILHQDREAFHWFGLARKSDDPKISEAAGQAWRNLRPDQQQVRVSGWIFPLYSSRWTDLFGYGQFKTEIRTGLPIVLYASVRFDGDARSHTGGSPPLLYSQTAFIMAAGIRTPVWHGVSGWFEAGTSASYLKGSMLPDYRGGVSATRYAGKPLVGEAGGWFGETSADAVFISRFGNDFLVYSQSRAGYTLGPKTIRSQFYWNGNLTLDTSRQAWANFVETGPGARFRSSAMPTSMFVVISAVRGAYLVNDGDPHRRPFNDVRAGVWYAFSH